MARDFASISLPGPAERRSPAGVFEATVIDQAMGTLIDQRRTPEWAERHSRQRVLLTHGVGPMRTYRIGAILLDLDDPTRILGQLPQPLLSPATDEQDGYVPNVVYSCGALLHADTLVLPCGIADAAIGIATVPLPELLAALKP